jgi:hypothetical protein
VYWRPLFCHVIPHPVKPIARYFYVQYLVLTSSRLLPLIVGLTELRFAGWQPLAIVTGLILKLDFDTRQSLTRAIRLVEIEHNVTEIAGDCRLDHDVLCNRQSFAMTHFFLLYKNIRHSAYILLTSKLKKHYFSCINDVMYVSFCLLGRLITDSADVNVSVFFLIVHANFSRRGIFT